MNISVIIPVYNEVDSIREIVKRVKDTKLAWEIVIVDDYSIDGTRDVLKEMEGKGSVRVIMKEKNEGKGSAVRAGITAAKGDVEILTYKLRAHSLFTDEYIVRIRDGKVDLFGKRYDFGSLY